MIARGSWPMPRARRMGLRRRCSVGAAARSSAMPGSARRVSRCIRVRAASCLRARSSQPGLVGKARGMLVRGARTRLRRRSGRGARCLPVAMRAMVAAMMRAARLRRLQKRGVRAARRGWRPRRRAMKPMSWAMIALKRAAKSGARRRGSAVVVAVGMVLKL